MDALMRAVRRRTSLMRSDAGYSTEAVVVTALLAVLGLTVIGIITAKVISRANGISLD
ncbi:hypothetical protein ACFQVC_21565 [Streptomyces monticola]|uniref:Flp family type IVb pilin n=1 Tax=Streptomyces monticola TaxID=2666263 RepID=A0ABW2JM14_9ACTN